MIQKIHTFYRCACTVEDEKDQETGEVVGRSFVIIDPESGDVWRMPMETEVAKKQGQRLMGIGNVVVPGGKESQEAILADAVARGGRKNGRR